MASAAVLAAVAAASALLLLAMASQLPPAAVAVYSPPPLPPTAIGMPNCTTSCGDVIVPYPFGLGPPHCYHSPSFKLTCVDDRGLGPLHQPRLLLGDGSLEVVEVHLQINLVRVVHTGGVKISPDGDGVYPGAGSLITRDDGPFFLASDGVNDLVVTGCNVQVTLHGDNGSVLCGCSSFCSSAVRLDENKLRLCNGVGCCNVPIPVGGTSYVVRLKSLDAATRAVDGGPVPVHVFVADFTPALVNGGDVAAQRTVEWISRILQYDDDAVKAPVMLGWGMLPPEVERAKRARAITVEYSTFSECTDDDAARSVCRSRNSQCTDIGRGYVCQCLPGYHGNPYLPDGCQDFNECEHPYSRGLCFNDYDCINTNGSYECRCPKGSHGDATRPNGCVKSKSSTTGLIVGIAFGSAAGSVTLVLIAIFMAQRFKLIRARNLKQKYFKQNRGQLLEKLVSQRADIAERMIIPVDEIIKATNNFDKARELGGGGHGTVYKGILSDLHVVAIKKSKISIQKEIDEFINEVAVLSQIKHKNIVNLFGCCLETDVPLLVYEFISNGTLFHHLHVEGPRSLSWETRLRIATETSSAVAYLHSSISVPIIHRDIKSTNILLDDALTSKVSDFGASRYIPVDKTGLTTRVQGTFGYLDPMYFYTGRLTDKSDIFSFGVILVELLTRKKPFSYLSSDGDGLVTHFVNLLAKDNLSEILDPQVIEEGGTEIQGVAMLAVSCINLRGEERPTMRQVAHTLQGLHHALTKYDEKDNAVAVDESKDHDSTLTDYCPSIKGGQIIEESSRRYSLEQDMLMSARYPR